jgi:hypothetical protein
MAASELVYDQELANAVRYGRTLVPADFVRIIEGDRTGPRAKLFRYAEALVYWQKRLDEVGTFGDHFEAVRIEGEQDPKWRLR